MALCCDGRWHFLLWTCVLSAGGFQNEISQAKPSLYHCSNTSTCLQVVWNTGRWQNIPYSMTKVVTGTWECFSFWISCFCTITNGQSVTLSDPNRSYAVIAFCFQTRFTYFYRFGCFWHWKMGFSHQSVIVVLCWSWRCTHESLSISVVCMCCSAYVCICIHKPFLVNNAKLFLYFFLAPALPVLASFFLSYQGIVSHFLLCTNLWHWTSRYGTKIKYYKRLPGTRSLFFLCMCMCVCVCGSFLCTALDAVESK